MPVIRIDLQLSRTKESNERLGMQSAGTLAHFLCRVARFDRAPKTRVQCRTKITTWRPEIEPVVH